MIFGILKFTFKLLFKLLILLMALLIVVWGLLNISGRIAYGKFYSTAESKISMPGINDGFIPQGLDNYADGFLMSGYMANKSASRIYYVTESGESKMVELKKEDGSDFKGHAGGIAHFEDQVYISGSDGLYVFSLADVMGSDGEAKQIGFFPVGLNAAWVDIVGNYLFAGSFFEEPDYETDEWQHITTPAGDKNTSVIMVFRLNSKSVNGINPDPLCAISTRNRVQGATFTEDGAILSTSISINSSVLYFYNYDESYKGEISVTIEETTTQIPLYYFDSSNLAYELKCNPMAEEIVVRDGRIYISNESASTKYIFGRLIGGDKFYSVEMKKDYFEKN